MSSKKILTILIVFIFLVLALLYASNYFIEGDFRSSESVNDFNVDRNISKPIGMGEESFNVRDGSISYYESSISDSVDVLNCTGGTRCSIDKLDQTYRVCEDWWAPDPDETDLCERTKQGLNHVSLKSDIANHITAPTTEEDFRVDQEGQKARSSYRDGPVYYLTEGWDIEIINDSKKLITSSSGEIYSFKEEQVSNTYTIEVYDSDDVSGGLLGLAADPEFQENNLIYAYYSYERREDFQGEGAVLSRISQFKLGSEGVDEEKVLVDKIPGKKEHYGGRLRIGPDDFLYATTGDAFRPEKAQDEDFLGGKILRVSLEGDIPQSNDWDNEVYAKGLRNPQGLDFHPESGDLVISQHGPWRRDEIRVVDGGAEYPWPEPCERSDPFQKDDFQPLFCSQTFTLAPSGIAFVDEPGHEWHGDLFVSGLRGRHVHRFELDDDMNLLKNEVFFASTEEGLHSRIRDVEYQDGGLWVLGDSQGIERIEPE